MTNLAKSALCLGLLSGALAALPASAQTGPYGTPGPYSAGPTESVIVVGPRFRADTTPLNGPMERVSLSIPVRYGDLDIATAEGAQVLRWRVADAARNVCQRLAEAYPIHRLSSSAPCYRDAVENGMVRANEAITTARQAYWYGYGY